jgi:thiosulfate/3-mercaptopyruvate sulfurtransferase
MSEVVSTQWLSEHLGEVRVVDASWYMPEDKRAPAMEFEAGHIPGAIFFDIDAIADHQTGLPHMLPTPHEFARAMGALGIGDGEMVVVYDGAGLFSAPRAWWTFKAMGHPQVKVLDGGLPIWKREGRSLETGPPRPQTRTFTARLKPLLVRGFEGMLKIVSDKTAQIVDARSAGRFTGQEPEPRIGLRSGHMPGAVNVHYRMLIASDGTLKPKAELAAIFQQAGIDPSRPIVTSCGSGLTAAILMLALEEIGAKDTALYDGSWTEWGSRPQAPAVTG